MSERNSERERESTGERESKKHKRSERTSEDRTKTRASDGAYPPKRNMNQYRCRQA